MQKIWARYIGLHVSVHVLLYYFKDVFNKGGAPTVLRQYKNKKYSIKVRCAHPGEMREGRYLILKRIASNDLQSARFDGPPRR